MIERVEFRLIAKSPIHVGSDSVSTVKMPYLLHLPQDEKKKIKINKELLKEFIKIIGSFYRNTKNRSYGYRSWGDIFKDRIFASLMTSSISNFFTLLGKRVDLQNESFYQYVTLFAIKLNKEENISLLQWARENIDIFVTSAIFCEDSSVFKNEFDINEDLCEIEIDITIPVIPGNSLRGHARRCLMNYVFEKLYGLEYQKLIKDTVYYTFFNGGMLTSSDGFINIEEKVNLRKQLPFLSIFGAMLGKEDLPGKMDFQFALLDCNETNSNNGRDGMSYLKEYFMTRRDDFEGLKEEATLKKMSSAIQMIYSALCIEIGSVFNWSINKKYMTEIESSFFDLMLKELMSDGKIGGMARAGYGEISYEFINGYVLKPDVAEKFIEANKDQIKKYISEM
jgi:CRISPR/Cas system CSM-associated protein Csm3 (group 7 of RAMP superfamily)